MTNPSDNKTPAPDNATQVGLTTESGGRLIYNWVSMIGTALAICGAGGALVALAIQMASSHAASYLGLVFLLFGLLVGVGALLVLIGVLRERRRRRLGLKRSFSMLLTLNLNRRSDRILIWSVMIGVIVGIGTIGTGSYQSMHYLESPDFCINACHSVMRPEGVAYEFTAHSEVACVECHVGEGMDSFVQSKLNGTRQLWGVITGDYERPIPAPVHNMKPASQTCQNCHWKERYIGLKEKVRTFYAADEQNSVHQVRMLMKIGGRRKGDSDSIGIHGHMLLDHKVEYIARDRRRQNIAWVQITNADGSTRVFNDKAKPLTEQEVATMEKRTMDCLDCHNRPAHRFTSPMVAMNLAMEQGDIEPSIPYIKRKGVEVLSEEYESTPAALEAIDATLRGYYNEEYADFVTSHKPQLDAAIDEVKAIFSRTNFPEMKARWSAYPENIGHRDSDGCFRCHNDSLVSKDDETIFTTCTKCHVVLAQGEGDAIQAASTDFQEGATFYHFGDDEELEEFTLCTDCHTGGADTYDE